MDSSEVASEVVYREDMSVFLFLSLAMDWPTSCIPLFSVELEPLDEDGGGGGVVHDGLVPGVSGSGDEREVNLMVPLERPDNARYTALLSSISDERTLPADSTISYSEREREREGEGGGGGGGLRGREGERESV